MVVRALISFCGKENMFKGEVRDISDLAVAMDLLSAGYVEKVVTEEKPVKPANKASKPRAKRTTPKGG